jgi:peptidoglycan hydrolase CwlO-like protein
MKNVIIGTLLALLIASTVSNCVYIYCTEKQHQTADKLFDNIDKQLDNLQKQIKLKENKKVMAGVL